MSLLTVSPDSPEQTTPTDPQHPRLSRRAWHPARRYAVLRTRSLRTRSLRTLASWAPVLGCAVWCLVRLLGLERGYPGVPLIAFTPYVAAASLVPLALALATRRWRLAVLAGLCTAILGWCVLPRATGDAASGPATGGGPTLRVLTINMLAGNADAGTIVRLVTEYRVDLLAVQELTPEGQAALEGAGLREVLPVQASFPNGGIEGSGLYAGAGATVLRSSFREHARSYFGEAYATIAFDGAAPIEVVSVHPCAPSSGFAAHYWAADYTEEEPAQPDGTVRILLGDFNATLDHAPLRRLIATGYRDAADVVGAGLTPTWPYLEQPWYVPHVTIDHVLADRRVGVRAASVHPVPGTDHRAVFAELVLPPAL